MCVEKRFSSISSNSGSSSSLQSYSQTLIKSVQQQQKSPQQNEAKIDCEVSHWKRTACNATCGEGYRWKSRSIIVSISLPCKKPIYFLTITMTMSKTIFSHYIQKHPENGGTPCPRRLVRLESCYVNCLPKDEPLSSPSVYSLSTADENEHNDDDDNNSQTCTYTSWSAWSPCSRTCGDSAVQIRTRSVLNHPRPHICTERLQERRCEVVPCLVENSFNYS